MLRWLKSKLETWYSERELLALDPLALRVRQERLTYLSRRKLLSLQRCRERVLGRVPGGYLEAGVALGGSSILLATWAQQEGRWFAGHDVFGMIPPPGERDGEDSHTRYEVIASGESRGIDGRGEYYGYMEDLREVVQGHFEAFGLEVDGDRIALHEGLFEDTLHPTRPIALAHIDCDWHDPVALCIERILPRLSPRGYIVFDDYNDYEGCELAVDEALACHPELELEQRAPNAVVRYSPAPPAS